MADAYHQIGGDLAVSATGDLALADGTTLGQQRVLQRLLTAPKAYVWHLNYGAGLPRFVGEVADKLRISAVARAQMFLEAAVSRTPAPAISVDVQATGVVTLDIKYVDADSKTTVPLNFNLNG